MHLRVFLVPHLLILGGLLFLTASRIVARSRHYPWQWLGVLGGGILFEVGRVLQKATMIPEVAVVAVRTQYAAAAIMIAMGVVSLEWVCRPEEKRLRTPWPASIIAAVLVVMLYTTDWLVTSRPVARVDLFDNSYFSARTGPLAPILVASAVAAAAIVTRRGSPSGELRPFLRRFRFVTLTFLALGLNDMAMSQGLRSIHLFDYAFATMVLIAHYYERQRTDAHTDTLEKAVGERTAALQDALAQRAESEARFRGLADASREAVLVCRAGTIVDRNRAAEALFGAGLGGRALPELFEGDGAAVARLAGGGDGATIETRGRRADGGAFVAEVAAGAGSGSSDAVILVRDVTEQRQLQQRMIMTDRLAAIGTLAAGTAHEINNPLTYVLGNVELLGQITAGLAARPPDDPLSEVPALLADVLSGGHRVRRIVQNLVTMARESTVDEGSSDLREVLRRSLDIAMPQLRHRARVELQLDDDLPPVAGSELRLGQVFVNLLVNAAQAIGDGHADGNSVAISAHRVDGTVCVAIRDTGSGIDAAVRDRIFDPFFTTKPVGQGTGLGLSVSLGIVTSLGGRIEVDSQPGEGTTFRVCLPAAAGPEPPKVAQGSGPLLPRGKILIVDDEPLVGRAIARLFARCDVTMVTSGAAALERCAAGAYDLVLCDLMMPNMTGIEVHRELRRRGSSAADRMVFMTGGAFTDEARDFLAQIPDRWVGKPVDRRTLLELASRVMGTPQASARS